MYKDYIFYRGYLERRGADDGGPGLLAATEVVQAVCDAGFQRYGFDMRCYPSSPHCYYKYAKYPMGGMYMLRAVKKTDMTTLDILIDTRLYPCFVMIEKHKDWQEETEEVKDTLEHMINDDADKFNWHVNLREHRTNTTQNIDEFFSALSYMYGNLPERHSEPVQIGQLILKVNGDNHYNDDINKEKPKVVAGESQPMDDETVEKLKPLFYNDEEKARQFLKEIEGMQPDNITELVNRWVEKNLISNYGNSRKGELWQILTDAGLYTRTRQNWNRRDY